MSDPYLKAMFGENAFQLGMNFIVQGDWDSGKAMGVFQASQGKEMMFGGKHTHQIILGDIVVRPHLVIGSEHLCGVGISGIYTSGWTDIEGWVRHGQVLLDSNGTLARLTNPR